jgi:hypothetical protein
VRHIARFHTLGPAEAVYGRESVPATSPPQGASRAVENPYTVPKRHSEWLQWRAAPRELPALPKLGSRGGTRRGIGRSRSASSRLAAGTALRTRRRRGQDRRRGCRAQWASRPPRLVELRPFLPLP